MRKGKREKVKKSKKSGSEWTRGKREERGAPGPRGAGSAVNSPAGIWAELG